MVCEMGGDLPEEMEIEVLPSMWPEDLGKEAAKQFNVEKPGADQDMLEEVNIVEEPSIVDFQRLLELTNYSEKGSSQLAILVKHWEYKQANAVRLLKEELDILSKQRKEVELKKLEILEAHKFEEENYVGDKRSISILDEVYDIWEAVPRRKSDVILQNKKVEVDAEFDTIKYWKQKAMQLDKLLEASMQREQILQEKLQENIKNMERQTSPVEELSQILKRADNFLHFVLQNAPVVIGHQDKELRYRFIYNHFPSLHEEDIIGRTDVEIFSGAGVKESQDFKKEVMERGLPAKREITFETKLFGSKTFLIYVEPVFSKTGDTIGVNYMGMDVTDQVIRREKMAKLREEIAVQRAKEKELNKTIHITEETMRAKQMLATMSHEIRSPLTGVVSMAEILSNTKLDPEQRQLLDVMLSSGDLVLQLINDILDLSKVESGVMKLEAAKFRPREVVKHVLQTAAASIKKELTLEGHVANDVPLEIVGDVLRIRQILTNLISNAIKFTLKGKVGINLQVVPGKKLDFRDGHLSTKHQHHPQDAVVWLHCDVYDTGIGIPEKALPTLFKKYMQVSADHARKYGGTGLGLAICKQLVELMGGHLNVSSQENCGSTFTFVLPCKLSPKREQSDDADDLSDMGDEASSDPVTDDATSGYFLFQPNAVGSLFSSGGATVRANNGYDPLSKLNSSLEDSYFLPSSNCTSRDSSLLEDAWKGKTRRINTSGLVMNRYNGSSTCPSNSQSGSHSPDCKKIKEESHRSESSEGESTSQGGNTEKSDSIKPDKSEVPKSVSKPKILLVEDNKINIMVTQSMMKQLGHTIDVVNNGLEAVRAVHSYNYDLVLMDVCMPVMDGLQATRIIRSFEENGNWGAAVEAGIQLGLPCLDSLSSNSMGTPRKRISIVAMTANALAESAAECLANGMDSFVSKPVTFQKLKQCLQQYLR
ncbi:histidine kinase 5-like [Aristolochia californica]|uniref:histidine kinase 5-like n=1 Tax=Aristolochia californica TaxID=171875 RepID=UPI0035DEC611